MSRDPAMATVGSWFAPPPAADPETTTRLGVTPAARRPAEPTETVDPTGEAPVLADVAALHPELMGHLVETLGWDGRAANPTVSDLVLPATPTRRRLPRHFRPAAALFRAQT